MYNMCIVFVTRMYIYACLYTIYIYSTLFYFSINSLDFEHKLIQKSVCLVEDPTAMIAVY